jgi:hypothetical protein
MRDNLISGLIVICGRLVESFLGNETVIQQ